MSEMVKSGSKYTDEDRRNAAMLYAIKGTLTAVEKDTGISKGTLHGWKSSDWWDTVIQQVRTENEAMYRSRFHNLVDQATDQALAKLPDATAQQAMTIAAIAYDKLRLSLNLPTSISGNTGTAEAMNKLMGQFRELSETYKARNINVVSEDGAPQIEGGGGQIRSDENGHDPISPAATK